MDNSSTADVLPFVSVLTLEKSVVSLDNIGAGLCRSVNEFTKVRKLGEGTYGVVYEGVDRKTQAKVALKQVRFEFDSRKTEGVSISTIREIYALKAIEQHENVVRLFDVVVGRRLRKIFLLMEYCDQDLATLLDNMQTPFTESQVKCLMLQLFRGLAHLHKSFLIHRDIKASNLLLTERGVLKIADFGLARPYGNPAVQMTAHVVTLWYRSPELLLGSKYQSTSIDMWACGCILGELLIHKPLLPGNSELDQLRQIINLLGTPTERIWPGMSRLKPLANMELFKQPYNNIKLVFGEDASSECIQLLNRLFAYDPRRRITAAECLRADYFTATPLPCAPSMMPSLSGLRNARRKRGRESVVAAEDVSMKRTRNNNSKRSDIERIDID